MLLANLAGADLSTEAAGSFTDIKADDYYAAATAWANRNGIVSGVGDGRFDPRAHVTREQLSVMLVRFADYMNWTLPASIAASAFADQPSISAYALQAATIAQQAGIITGKSIQGRADVNFAPKDSALVRLLFEPNFPSPIPLITSRAAKYVMESFAKLRADVNFAPKDPATREETAHMLAKLLKLSQ